MKWFMVFCVTFVSSWPANADNGQPNDQPSLFFREDTTATPPALPITQDHIANKHLALKLYGPGAAKGVKKSHHANKKNDPHYIWSGRCKGKWAVAFRHRDQTIDLAVPNALIRWRTKQSNRTLRIVIKLDDGTAFVSQQGSGPTKNWHVQSFKVTGLAWRKLDLGKVAQSDQVATPDLTRVDEVGFTDLEPGGSSPNSSRVDWIEVYGVGQARENPIE